MNDALPIHDFKDQIVDAVDRNQVVIITAETGAGKSTQVPQYLAEHGYNKVVVTQPRILAARNLTRRVREEWAMRTGKDSDEVIGYRTAHERDDGPHTSILYCTDGLQLVREITGAGINERQVLVLDEMHEWNENMEVLVAWAKKRCLEEPRFKVVIMSATIETDTLAEYFDTSAVVAVPGRSYEVTRRRGTDVISEIIDHLNSVKSNMLVFLPGKAEIENVAEVIQTKANAAGVPVIPLHSQLEASAQQQAFIQYSNGKVILSTNIAQTSVTIDDIDVVIDSGLERRSEVRNGVEGLFIAQISQADCLQRAGRAGRTKPGEYILAPYDTMPCLEFDERPIYGTPEILRKHIDRLTLRLANVGIDIEMLDFYHDPSKKAIQRAKRTLIALGALTKTGDVTRIGRQMEQFPVESSFGRMLVESNKYSPDVQAKLAIIIAIQEVGGIVKGGTRYTGWRKLTKQTKSDLLAQYDVFMALSKDAVLTIEEREEMGVITKNITKAQEIIERLDRDLGLSIHELLPIGDDEEPLLRSIIAGQIDQLWMIDEKGEATHITTNQRREVSSSTVVRQPKLVTGTPFDLQIPLASGGLETLHLLQNISVVSTDWLVDLAPQSFASRNGKSYYNPRTGRLETRELVRFGKQILEGQGVPITETSPTNKKLFVELFAKWAYEQIERERRTLGRYHTKRIPSVSLQELRSQVKAEAGDVIGLDQLNPQSKARLIKLAKLHTHIGTDLMAQIGSSHRFSRHHGRSEGRGWQPRHKRKNHDKHRRDMY